MYVCENILIFVSSCAASCPLEPSGDGSEDMVYLTFKRIEWIDRKFASQACCKLQRSSHIATITSASEQRRAVQTIKSTFNSSNMPRFYWTAIIVKPQTEPSFADDNKSTVWTDKYNKTLAFTYFDSHQNNNSNTTRASSEPTCVVLDARMNFSWVLRGCDSGIMGGAGVLCQKRKGECLA